MGIAEIKPGHPIWDEIWKRCDPTNPDHASFLTQLYEAKLQLADHIEREKVLREALNGIVKSLTKGNRGDDRMLSIDNMELSTLLKQARAALRTVEDSNGD